MAINMRLLKPITEPKHYQGQQSTCEGGQQPKGHYKSRFSSDVLRSI